MDRKSLSIREAFFVHKRLLMKLLCFFGGFRHFLMVSGTFVQTKNSGHHSLIEEAFLASNI